MQSFVASFVPESGAPACDNDRAQAPDMQSRAGEDSRARKQATELPTGRWPDLLRTPASIAAGNFQLYPQLPRPYRPFHRIVATPRELPDNFALMTRSGCESLATCLVCCARVLAVACSGAEWQTG